MVTGAKVRELAQELPSVEEKPSHGVPTFRVKGKLFAALREDLGAIAIKLDFDERDSLIEAQPEIFYFTDHYRNYPMVLARLRAIPTALLRDLLRDAWLRTAPKRLASEFKSGGTRDRRSAK